MKNFNYIQFMFDYFEVNLNLNQFNSAFTYSLLFYEINLFL